MLSCSKDDRGDLVGVKASKFFPNKPQGMVVHPGAGNKINTLVNILVGSYKKKLSNLSTH